MTKPPEPNYRRALTPQQLIDELTYSSYSFNRRNRPDIKPQSWATIYPQADKLEERFQREHGANDNAP